MATRLVNLLKARFPLIYISTYEEDRITKYIKSIVSDEKIIKHTREVFTWTQTDGLYSETIKKHIPDTSCPAKMLEFVRKYEKDSIFLLYDFHVYFGPHNRTPDANVIRKIRDIIPDLKFSSVRKCLFFIAPELLIPNSLQKEITIFDFPLPSLNEIRTKLDSMLNQNDSIENNLTDEDKDKLCKGALGLTLQEAESAFALAMVNDGKLSINDLPVILEEKVQVIKKTGLLEYIKSDYSIDDIGGLDNLKTWLLKRNNFWSEKAKKYCIPAPKGILITGVPGCGKSLTAKAMSSIWQLPLLRLDFSKMFSGLVGSSEENMRQALSIAEAVAPTILWVDEIEKGLSGLGSQGDSGVSSRIFGQFLTWMQEKESPVFVIATANNINNLPPELLRKGRFDEIFFVDLPTLSERKDIFKLHLKKRLRDKEVASEIVGVKNLFTNLAKLTEGFIGSEIEQVIISSLCDAYYANRPLSYDDIVKNIQNTVPLSTTQKEQILALRNWANVRAVSATKTIDKKQYSNEINEENISSSRGGRTLDF